MSSPKPPQDHLLVAVLKLFESETIRMWMFILIVMAFLAFAAITGWYGSRSVGAGIAFGGAGTGIGLVKLVSWWRSLK